MKEKDNGNKTKNLILKLADESIAEVKWKHEWDESTKLIWGVKGLCFKVIRLALAVKKEAEKRLDQRVEGAVFTRAYWNFQEEHHKILQGALNKLMEEHRIMYTGMEVYNIMDAVYKEHGAAVKKAFGAIDLEEVARSLKTWEPLNKPVRPESSTPPTPSEPPASPVVEP